MSNSSHRTALKVLSVCLWIIALLTVSTYFIGSLAIPVIFSLFVASIIASCVAMTRKEQDNVLPQKCNKRVEEGLLEKGLSAENIQRLYLQESELEVSILGAESDPGPIDSIQEKSLRETRKRKQVSFNPSAVVKPCPQADSPIPSLDDVNPQLIPLLKKSSHHLKSTGVEQPKGMEEIDGTVPISPRHVIVQAQNNNIFFVLLTACLLLVLWKHPTLFLLLIPFAIWSCIKHAFTLTVVKHSVGEQLLHLSQTITKWFHAQNTILIPWPMPMMYTIYLFIDKKVLEAMKKTIGSLVSALIIFVLLVGVFTAAVLLVLQIKVEVTHYANSAGSVWNNTVTTSPQIRE